VLEVLVLNEIVVPGVQVIPETSVKLPYISTPDVNPENVGDPDRPVRSMFFPSLGMSQVTVLPATNALLITTSS
jgi:hypothetical protein